MEIKYTIRIKPEKNPPTFKEELGKGVVATQVAVFKDVSEKDLEDNIMLLGRVIDLSEQLKNEWFEVIYEVIKD
jgi:hypothetical protein